MTPEQRFTKIENALQTIAEHQAEHAEEIKELRRMQKSLMVGVAQMRKEEREYRRAADLRQQRTDEQLKDLAATVNRFIKGQGRNGHREKH